MGTMTSRHDQQDRARQLGRGEEQQERARPAGSARLRSAIETEEEMTLSQERGVLS